MSEQRDDDSSDEFRFLVGDAARVGADGPLPAVRRVRVEVSDGRGISGLVFTPNAQASDASAPPAVAALHGAGLNAHSFDPMLLALGAPAVALDLPGHGRSDWRADADYRPGTMASDVAAAIERLAPQPVALVGHSLGGLTAAIIASERPDLVERLIVVDITPGVSPAGDAGAVAEFILGKRDYGSIEEIVDRAVEFGIGSDRTALTRGVTLNTRLRADGRIEWTHHLAHLDRLPAAPGDPLPYAPIWAALETAQEHGIPVSLVRATRGMLTEAHVAEWRQRLPHSEIVEVAGPHNLHEAAPVELAGAVRGLCGGGGNAG
ncbi:alpha/beta fold hydrolase [Leucobacter ruminantium]|uniref:Alpha/beta fold hydrolase n=1 Tax=Leucobacter ruminantium TaxID=1289170 RepID=A0A939RXC2_9MICO|nr:alpha/beta fold hydrolase [Leucobacter ruminantium]MBO1803736.1 alpha/beta fold hydrolase [Leucobacter ruminantium]